MRGNLGEIKHGREIGKKPDKNKFIWAGCLDCGKQRWVEFLAKKPRIIRCRSCSARNSHRKGGRINKDGYKLVKLHPDDFFYPMAQCDGYVFEHRFVMARHLGRNLHRWELVHHKKGIAKNDNRIEGLQLVSEDKHNQITIMEKRITFLEARVALLEVENIALKAEREQVYEQG